MKIRFFKYAGGERISNIMVWAILGVLIFITVMFFKLDNYYQDFGSFLKNYLNGNIFFKILIIVEPIILVIIIILFLQIFRDFYFLISKKKIGKAVVRNKKIVSSTPSKTGTPSHTNYYIFFEHKGKIFRQEISHSAYQLINVGDYIQIKYTDKFIHKAKAIIG